MGTVYRSEEHTDRESFSIYNDDGTATHITEAYSVYIDEEIPIDIAFSVSKSKDDEQLVSGWANVAVNADGSLPLDWQGDVIPPEVLEKAALDFMLDYRGSGEMHKGDSKGTVVESIVFTKEKQEALGIPEGTVPQGWFITVKVNDPELFAKVKDGTYKMFSIQGTCSRVVQE